MGTEWFTYNESYGLNSIIFSKCLTLDGIYEFIDREKYTFGCEVSNIVSIYGTFTHINSCFAGGRYDYYTSVSITTEQYRLIKLVCLNDGWVSIK